MVSSVHGSFSFLPPTRRVNMVVNIRAFERRVGRARCDRLQKALGKLPDGFRVADLPDLLFEAVPGVPGGPSREDLEVLCVASREDGSPTEEATDSDGAGPPGEPEAASGRHEPQADDTSDKTPVYRALVKPRSKQQEAFVAALETKSVTRP